MYRVQKNYCKVVGERNEENRFAIKAGSTNIKLNKEQVDALKEFITDISPQEICIFPNWNFGWLTPFSGYCMSLDLDRPFKCDPFMGESFKVISLFEIQYDRDLIKRFDSVRASVRKVFGFNTKCPPTLDDDETSGWEASLEERGCLVGVYFMQEKRYSTEQTDERMFIAVLNGLHRQTVDKLQARDYAIDTFNRKYASEYRVMESNTNSNNTDVDDDSTDQKYTTFGEEFGPGSLKERMLQITKENNRRVAVQFQEAADLAFINQTPVPSGTSKYRTPLPPMEMSAFNSSFAESALEWWPRNVMITPCTVIQNSKIRTDAVKEAQEVLPSLAIQGFRIGEFLQKLKYSNPTEFERFRLKYDIRFEEFPQTVTPLLESDYNTFKVEGNKLVIYSQTTSVLTASNAHPGIIRQCPHAHGFECINTDLFVDQTPKQWDNNFLRGYPVVFPFDANEQKINVSSDDMSIKFFDSSYGGSTKAKACAQQLLGRFKNIEEMKINDSVKEDIMPDHLEIQTVSLIPYLVFFSPLPVQEPKYNILNV